MPCNTVVPVAFWGMKASSIFPSQLYASLLAQHREFHAFIDAV